MIKKFIILFLFITSISFLFYFITASATVDVNSQNILEENTKITELKVDKKAEKSQNMWTNIIVPIAVEFLGAFLGVLTALGLNLHKSKKQYKELNKSLLNELLTVKKDLEKRFSNNQEYYRYATPVWDINWAAGNLSILANRHIDKEYIHIYSKIQYAQELEREYIHSRLIENSNNTFLDSYVYSIDSARKREGKEIKDLIEDLSKEVK